jgi:iron(III) transport system substrate-binding protein
VRSASNIAAVVLALLVCGCGGSNGSSQPERKVNDVLASVAGLSGKARTARLRELAQAEGGRLDLYSTLGGDTLEKLIDDFEDRYDVSIAAYRADSDILLARILEEDKADFRGSDVVQANGLAMTVLRKRDLLVPFTTPVTRSLAENAVYDGWIAYQSNPFAVTWNTKLVPSSERPRSWEELAEPRWRGRLALEEDDVDWYKTLRDYWVEEAGKTEEDADRLFEAIGRNAVVVSGHTLAAQLQAAGEFELAVNYTSAADRIAREGAPISWRPAVEPVIWQPNGVGLVRGAPHPATALLFADYLLNEGQKILAEDFREPVRKDLATTKGVEYRVADFAALEAEQERWAKEWQHILGLGTRAAE